MPTFSIFAASLLPLVVSAAVAFVARRLRVPVQLVWPLSVACGFLAAQFTLRGHTGFTESLATVFQPHEAVDWLPHIVLLALGVSALMIALPSHRPWLIAAAAALCLAAPVRLLSGNLAQHWIVAEKLGVLLALTISLATVWSLLAASDGERPVAGRAPLLILVAIGVAIVVTQSGALMYGLSAAALGAAVTGTALILAVRTSAPSSTVAAAAGIITFALGGLIILAHFYAELSATSAALLLFSLVATGVPLPMLLSSSTWQRAAARLVLCVLPLAVALAGVVL